MTIKKQHLWIDREYDRISTEIPCRIGPVGGARKSAVIVNLSAGGLKFTCSREVFDLLLPEDQRIPGQIGNVDIEIQFQLHSTGSRKPLNIRTLARIIYTERLAQDSYTAGVKFLSLGETDVRALATSIRERNIRPGWL